jgi:hypothetical protein
MSVAFRITWLVFLVSAHASSRLAAAFQALSRASRRWGGLVLPLQLPVLVAWYPARVVSLGTFAICAALTPRLS